MSDDDIAIGADGRPLPMAPRDVRQMVLKMIDEGEILLILVKVKDDLACQVFGPPSMAMVEELEQFTHALRHAVEAAH